MTLEELVDCGFIEDGWPEELPPPGDSSIKEEVLDGPVHRYTYSAQHDGKTFAACVDVNHELIETPAEGVVFMLNQFAYLYRAKPDRVLYSGGEPYKTNFG